MFERLMTKGLEWMLIAMLSLMVLLVFGNVVLRYGFNSGITFSEEVSRFLFVWVTFLGSVLLLRDGGHLGVHILTGRLSPRGRRACRFTSDLLVFLCCALLTKGAWHQTMLSVDNHAPASGLSLAVVYSATLFCGVGMGVILLNSMYRLATGRMTDDELNPGDVEDAL
ncbi:TRAP transporter small permease [Azospirillum oleiclasticum]